MCQPERYVLWLLGVVQPCSTPLMVNQQCAFDKGPSFRVSTRFYMTV